MYMAVTSCIVLPSMLVLVVNNWDLGIAPFHFDYGLLLSLIFQMKSAIKSILYATRIELMSIEYQSLNEFFRTTTLGRR
jgi:hypothetical protein